MEISFDLSESGIDKAIRELDAYQELVESKCQKLVDRLTQMGVSVASARFASAVYDGVNDVTVRAEQGGGYSAIVAEGNAVLFIEFGTGVTHASPVHPEASSLGFSRGSYGAGKGSQRSWRYYGEPGTSGEVISENEKGTLVQTRGNPAGMCLYETEKYLESVLRQVVKEVFRS